MVAIPSYDPGFRLVTGDSLNVIITAVNNLTGNGTSGNVVANVANITTANITTLIATDFTTTNATITTIATMFAIPRTTVAAAGGNIATAAALTAGFNSVTASDSTKGVILPVARAGLICIVKNTVAGQTLPVYPQISSAINAIAANGAYSITAANASIFVADSTTLWYTASAVGI